MPPYQQIWRIYIPAQFSFPFKNKSKYYYKAFVSYVPLLIYVWNKKGPPDKTLYEDVMTVVLTTISCG